MPLFWSVESIDGRGMLRVDIGWYLVGSNAIAKGESFRTYEGGGRREKEEGPDMIIEERMSLRLSQGGKRVRGKAIGRGSLFLEAV